jgi:hypothetical protein
MKYYFCDCPESLRLHEDGTLGDVAMRSDVEIVLRRLEQLQSGILSNANDRSIDDIERAILLVDEVIPEYDAEANPDHYNAWQFLKSILLPQRKLA